MRKCHGQLQPVRLVLRLLVCTPVSPGLRTVRNRFPLLTPSHFRSNCHCERSVAISMRLNTRRLTALATTTRLPRCARNDIGGQWKGAGLVGPQFAFPLLGDAEPGVWDVPLVLGVSPSPQPSPIEGEGVIGSRAYRLLEPGGRRGDLATALVDAAAGLPRYARNNTVRTHDEVGLLVLGAIIAWGPLVVLVLDHTHPAYLTPQPDHYAGCCQQRARNDEDPPQAQLYRGARSRYRDGRHGDRRNQQ